MESNSNSVKPTSFKISQSKYLNKKATYQGRKYDSQKEANHSQMLDLQRKATLPAMRVVDIKYQCPYLITINSKKICVYKLDFLVTYADGRVEHHDVKGFATPVYKLKKKMVEAFYGIRIIEK